MQVSVRDLMTSQPPAIHERASIQEATRQILDLAVSELYVVDSTGRLLGAVSDYELLKAMLVQSDPAQPVERFMGRRLLVLTPDMLLEDVADLFRESCHHRVPVIEQGVLIGELSRRDVLRAMLVLDELRAFETTTPSHRRIESAEVQMPPRPLHLRPVDQRICQLG